MILIGKPARAALAALLVLLSIAPAAQARNWRDRGRADDQDQSQGHATSARQQNDFAPRDYAEPRAAPQRGPGISLDSAVSQARREGRVLSADVVDGGAYRIKVLTPDGRVRVLYFGGP